MPFRSYVTYSSSRTFFTSNIFTMNTQKSQSHSRWFHWKQTVVFALVAWVPHSLGRVLRRLVYRAIFARIGISVQIQPGVEFVCPERIEIRNGVKIDRHVRIINFGRNSKICIADRVHLERGVDIKIHGDGKVEIGENTFIGPYVCLSGKSIKIGKDCMIASHSSIYANNHNFAERIHKIKEQGLSYKGIVIEDDCWLGSGVRVVDGITIGQGSVIGAGAVVTKDIPPYSVAVGVPAKVISRRNIAIPSKL